MDAAVVFVVETVRRGRRTEDARVVVVVEEAAERELEERVMSGVRRRVRRRPRRLAAAALRGRTAAVGRDRFGDVEVGRVGGVRHGRHVRRRAPADVVERDAVEVGVPLELVGAAVAAEPLALVAQQTRDEIASCRTQVVHVRNVQRRRPVKHLCPPIQ